MNASGVPTTGLGVQRVAIFYDGSFFQKFNIWCSEVLGGYINFKGLHDYVAFWIRKTELERRGLSLVVRIVEAHYFQGRFKLADSVRKGQEKGKPFPVVVDNKSTKIILEPNASYLAKDRLIDQLLMDANITMHYYPTYYHKEQERGMEKGIDVWLSLESYDLAVHKRFDYFLLFSGDQDFVPLIRKINSLGITTIVTEVNIKAEETSKGHAIVTSNKLTDEATLTLPLSENLREKDKAPKQSDPKYREWEMLKKIIHDRDK